MKKLQQRGVQIGDRVLHLHVVSNSERSRLQKLGFAVPYDHWDQTYYAETLVLAHELMQSNPSSLGIFCEDSWVFDPALHHIASDGRPLVSFGFLADDRFVGERFLVGIPRPEGPYPKQYEFALRSSRRRALHGQGEFTPKTYGIFYPKDQLRLNLPAILRSLSA